MSTQKIGNIKIPRFDKDNYNLWKMKMMLFMKATNPMFLEILKNGPFIPLEEVPASTSGTVTILASYKPKDPSKWNDTEKEKVALDSHLQLIIIDSMELSMFVNIAAYTTAKEVWENIEILCEDTEEVGDNKKQILVSQYEAFMAQPKEGITEVFERFHKLINDLQLSGKVYTKKELNMKFLLTVPTHLEGRVSSLKERDMNKISYDVLYGVLKTHEFELIQKRAIQAKQGSMVNTSCALICDSVKKLEDGTSRLRIGEIVDEDQDSKNSAVDDEESEFYSLKELDAMENSSYAFMARKFPNLRFKRNQPFKANHQSSSSFNKGKTLKKFNKSGYKTGTVDMQTVRCYRCNDTGHFASDCTKPKTKSKEYLDLEAKYNALKKQSSKAYIAEGKC